jgi:polyphosphate kinase 2 (PPK2 family)
MDAYQAAIDETNTPDAPWHVVPANKKWYARIAVQQLLLGAMSGLNLAWPKAEFDVAAERELVARS